MVDFQRNVWALIQAGLAGAQLTAAGRSEADPMPALPCDAAAVAGSVPEEVHPHLDAALVAIAPLHYGDAAEEKIGEALRRGLPVVGTSRPDRRNGLGSEGPSRWLGKRGLSALQRLRRR